MYTDFKEKAIEYVKQAVEEDNAGNYDEALKLYMYALEYFKTHLKYEKNPKAKEAITNKVRAVIPEEARGKRVSRGTRQQADRRMERGRRSSRSTWNVPRRCEVSSTRKCTVLPMGVETQGSARKLDPRLDRTTTGLTRKTPKSQGSEVRWGTQSSPKNPM